MGHKHSRVNNMEDNQFNNRLTKNFLKRQRMDSLVTDNDSSSPTMSDESDNCSHQYPPLFNSPMQTTSPSLFLFPQLITALQSDESTMIACYNPFKEIVYLSDSGYQTMGIDVSTPLGSASLFPAAPSRGAIFFQT
jgi:hypothetical protein